MLASTCFWSLFLSIALLSLGLTLLSCAPRTLDDNDIESITKTKKRKNKKKTYIKSKRGITIIQLNVIRTFHLGKDNWRRNSCVKRARSYIIWLFNLNIQNSVLFLRFPSYIFEVLLISKAYVCLWCWWSYVWTNNVNNLK